MTVIAETRKETADLSMASSLLCLSRPPFCSVSRGSSFSLPSSPSFPTSSPALELLPLSSFSLSSHSPLADPKLRSRWPQSYRRGSIG
ncbi:unnamed protein product [Musa acuminata subsp. malaccensis]|uniref:(wild Malaysian banana) hypothetical protein n=1 Tax=Musa acuminata subsp. malaccensis TaxID=214687 RepID=A0A8D7B4N2_MUSAM|nr:unnamed protein product [Musa acuminata subsp. malaccensis]